MAEQTWTLWALIDKGEIKLVQAYRPDGDPRWVKLLCKVAPK